MSVGLGLRRRDVTGIYRVGSGDSKMPLGLQGHAHMHIGHGSKSDGHTMCVRESWTHSMSP